MVLIVITGILVLLIFIGFTINYHSKNKDSPLLLEKLTINKSTQYISLSEEPSKKEKPIVLFLHGGPGSANISLINHLCPKLNEHAVIVNWDQRSAGKSFQLFQSGHLLNFEQNVQDAHILTQYLKEKYSVEKITLIGFSAGTALGIILIDRYPHDYSLYISVAQMVDGKRGELLSLSYTLQKAKERQDTKAIQELEKIHFDFTKPLEILTNTQKQRKYLLKFGGVYHTFDSYKHEIISLWRSKEYGFFDFLFWPLASSISLKAMWHEIVLMKIDKLVPSVNVPIVFFSGAYDMNAPTELVIEYFEKLNAPKGEEYIMFEHSAHGLIWDEPEKFTIETIKAIEKYAN